MNSEHSYTPVDVSEIDLSKWGSKSEWPVTLANFCAMHAPRGKAWFPRLIGRIFGNQIHSYLLTKHGARLAIEPSSLDMFAFLKTNHGRWSDNVFNTCASFLRKGSVFYDIGANVGYMSMDMAQLFENQITIVAVEPQPNLSRNIALSAKLNGFKGVTVLQLMLGETEGRRDLFLASSSIHASAVGRENTSKTVSCPLTTLDRLVEGGKIPPPHVMKMDVEGGEMAVFRGATNTLRNYRPVVVFECDENARRFQYTKHDIIAYISSVAEYDFFDIANDGTLLPVTAAPADVLAKPKLL